MAQSQAAKNFVQNRKRAYQLCFSSPAGQEILIDLAKFCRAAESCYHDDARKHAVLEGRREVFLRIQENMQLTVDQLYSLYAGNHFIVQQPESEDD